MLDTFPGLHGDSSPSGKDCQEMRRQLYNVTYGKVVRCLARSAATEKRGSAWRGVLSIFHWVVGVGSVVKQRWSEDLREVWEGEETSVAGAEWVKRRAAG